MGSGKSTLARKLSKELKIKRYPLDNLYWTKKYTRKRNRTVLKKKLKELVKKKKWIIEGVFVSWTEEVFKKADLIIWLDLDYKLLRKNILKRYFLNKFTGTEKERGSFLDILKIIKHTKKYRTGEHKNSYQGHKRAIDKHKTPFVSIKSNKQLNDFTRDFLAK